MNLINQIKIINIATMIKINDLVDKLVLMKYKNYNEKAALLVKYDKVLLKKIKEFNKQSLKESNNIN